MTGRSILTSAVLLGMMVTAVSAGVVSGVRFRPAIWVDPDGCEHWVLDTGLEGYMSLRLQKDGKPVCHAPVDDGRYVIGADGLVVVEPRP